MLDAKRMLPMIGGRKEIRKDKLIDYLHSAITVMIDQFYLYNTQLVDYEKVSLKRSMPSQPRKFITRTKPLATVLGSRSWCSHSCSGREPGGSGRGAGGGGGA